jgi:hypothetical protein
MTQGKPLPFPPFSDIIRSSSSYLFEEVSDGLAYQHLDWASLYTDTRWLDQIKEEIFHSPHPETLTWFYIAFFIKILSSRSSGNRPYHPSLISWIADRLNDLTDQHALTPAPWPLSDPALPLPALTRPSHLPAFTQICFTNYVRAYLHRAMAHISSLARDWGRHAEGLSALSAALTAPGRRLSAVPSTPDRVRRALQWLNTVDRVLQLLDPSSGVSFFGQKVADLDAYAAERREQPRCTDFDLGIDALGADIRLVGELFATECRDLALPPVDPQESKALSAEFWGTAVAAFRTAWYPLAAVYFALLALWVNEVLKVEARLPIVAALAEVTGAFRAPGGRRAEGIAVRRAAVDCEAVRIVSAALKGFIEVVNEFQDKLLYYAPPVQEGDDPVTIFRAIINEGGFNFAFDQGIETTDPAGNPALIIWAVIDSYKAAVAGEDA